MLDNNGSIIKTHFFVEGRKCPLREVREQKLEELKEYMRANMDDSLDVMSGTDIAERLHKLHEMKDGEDVEEMRQRLKDMERTRHLMNHDLA